MDCLNNEQTIENIRSKRHKKIILIVMGILMVLPVFIWWMVL